MGLPKLFKYLSERYPNLSQVVPANQLPQYDYLYIDLNNLIHKAVSEKNLLPLEQLDDDFFLEERVFERIFCYIETLHRIIPSKILFLSIDGVAPRAKWATQRERRLRTVENDKNILQTQFDTNAISPGTTFMVNFEKYLMEYLSNKAKHHANWQNCEILVSGSSSPGEGSIKIIDFIRSMKQSKDFVPYQTHCIYSGDNDYLLLGLATHELYISLVHEQKKFGSSLTALCLNDTRHTFEVIHFEMLRQYLRMEFVECQNKMSFEFDMDRICDDWVVLMTLIGNDYVPALPNFHLDHNVLTMIYDAYKQVLKISNGYINEFGLLNLRRFARLIHCLKPKDFDLYCNNCKNQITSTTDQMSTIHLNNNNNNNVDETETSKISVPRISDFMEMKDEYYTQQLGNSKMPDYEQMSASYIKMVQWTLFYYYHDTCSWNHYYPYSCVPFVSDLVDVHKTTFNIEFDKPVEIFTHLLAILPTKSAHLLPKSYQLEMFDELKIPDDMLARSRRAEKKLFTDDEKRNAARPTLKLQYVESEKSSNCVKVTEIFVEKKNDRDDKTVHRPFNRHDFNFQFSALNLHDYTFKLVEPSVAKPYQRILISLNTDRSCDDVISASESFIDQSVYINWPHFTEAKVLQIFDGSKKVDQSNGVNKITENPPEFSACVDQLNARYSECGIDVGEIKLVAYVAPLKWMEYKPSEAKPNAYELVQHWDDKKWIPVAVQTIVPVSMLEKDPQYKLAKDVLCGGKSVVLFSNHSYHFGEFASVADNRNLETNGRVNILSYMDLPPNFEKAIQMHTATKTSEINEFKQPSTAAVLLGITEKVFARVTGSVLVSQSNASGKKINIGLQLKIRGLCQSNVAVLDGYVKNNNKQFVYSQLAIDLVQQYMDKFPRVFELLNTTESNTIAVSEFEHTNNNGKQPALEYLAEIRSWLQSLPKSQAKRTSIQAMHLSNNAIKHVQHALQSIYGADAKVLRIKMKWQNLYVPDFNDVFAVPCPDASYKLLDRVVVVRSGYPISINTKGTIVAIEPSRNHTPGTEITEDDLYTMDILMDYPYKVPLATGEFKRHQIFRTRSTNMLINISHGRTT